MRAFLAVVPPREARDKVEAAREPLKELAPEGRWVHPSLWHLTLKFLGDVEDELIPAVADLVGEVAGRMDSFEVVLSGTGLFPNADRPRILWVGVTEGVEQLRELAESIDVGLDGLGFEPDERGFQPHMTVARFRENRDAGEVAQQIGPGEEIARFPVEAVVLMKSVLRPRGPDYTVIEKLPLICPEKPESESPEDQDAESEETESGDTPPASFGEHEPVGGEGND